VYQDELRRRCAPPKRRWSKIPAFAGTVAPLPQAGGLRPPVHHSGVSLNSVPLGRLPTMKLAFLAAMALLCVGCAITREEAVSIATREVTRRNLPLPKGYVTAVTPSQNIVEFEPTRPIWEVTFSLPGAKKPLYDVTIDQYNRAIETFLDYRYLSR
jgi:hypothetical protein